MKMTVQELIDQLNQVDDKTKPVKLVVSFGMGSYELTDSFDVDDEDDEVILSGESTQSD